MLPTQDSPNQALTKLGFDKLSFSIDGIRGFRLSCRSCTKADSSLVRTRTFSYETPSPLLQTSLILRHFRSYDLKAVRAAQNPHFWTHLCALACAGVHQESNNPFIQRLDAPRSLTSIEFVRMLIMVLQDWRAAERSPQGCACASC